MNIPDSDKDKTLLIGFPEYETQAQALAKAASLPYATVDLHHFPDGESKLLLPTDLPEQVILCRSLDRPNDKLVELILAAAGIRNLGAKTVSLVAPYLCYMRQDKAFHPGEIVSQKIIGKCLANYFDGVLTVDAHLHRVHDLADAIPVQRAINITATNPMAHFMQQHVERPYLLGPDGESVQWVSDIAAHYQMDYGVAQKERYGDRQVKVNIPVGDYGGRNIVLVDDVASTGKTLLEAAKGLQKYKPASISVLVTHALFVDDAIPQLKKAGIGNIWSCDSIPHPSNAISLAEILADNL
ncbi:MAG TPA: ribose-phosphate diphosphokinase [Thiolapillus brandeum]|uniref:Ribose-phosphate diphosphokinase n=1 Tax=Thiolapillus brandeum TaxID=1076588 RepID=A0A831K4A6_9GAMM|nr:ribose-phosphate diphosphokinase [Thiolapillus brandeum]